MRAGPLDCFSVIPDGTGRFSLSSQSDDGQHEAAVHYDEDACRWVPLEAGALDRLKDPAKQAAPPRSKLMVGSYRPLVSIQPEGRPVDEDAGQAAADSMGTVEPELSHGVTAVESELSATSTLSLESLPGGIHGKQVSTGLYM